MRDLCPGQFVLAYDVGGSHVSAALCRHDSFELGRMVSAPHPAEETSEAFVNVIFSLGAQAAEDLGCVAGAALAMPGPFDYAAGIGRARHKLAYLYGVDLREALALRFGWDRTQILFLNDAAAFLLGEIGAGAARHAKRAVGITLGTGIGASFAVEGRIVTDGPGVPPGGEIWNFPSNGGIIEDSISARAIQINYQNRAGKSNTVAEIAAIAPSNADAAEVFADYGRNLGQAVRLTLAPFRPNVVVLGGNIARSAHLFLPAAKLELDGLDLRIEISALFDRAPLVGAGVAWFQSFAKSTTTAAAAI
jgi:glucokinase